MNRPTLRYFGGKFLLAPWVIEHFPDHRVYVEPYGGAASVLLQKKRSYAEIYNDIESGVVSFFRVLQNPEKAQELERLLRVTPFARDEFKESHNISKEMCDIEKARRMIIRSFMGFGADSVSNTAKRTGFRANSNRSGSTPAHDWANYPEEIKVFTERLSGVVIENRPAMECFDSFDGPDTLFFLDPPYVHQTRKTKHGYNFEMTDQDHQQLLDRVQSIKGMVILCGYDNLIYNNLKWEKIRKKACADGARDRIECLWMNDNCRSNLKQLSFV